MVFNIDTTSQKYMLKNAANAFSESMMQEDEVMESGYD